MMATVCGPCGGPLVLLRENFDVQDRVYVGSLRCAACGARYLDQRRPTQQRVTSAQPALPFEEKASPTKV